MASHKNSYEIAYMGSKGDAKNMYVKMDPDANAPLPSDITQIQNAVSAYENAANASNLASSSPTASTFKCGPPDGVPIQQWLPAIFCWLGTILPPSISAGNCSSSDIP